VKQSVAGLLNTDVRPEQIVTKFIVLISMNLVTLKAPAKRKILFNKPASEEVGYEVRVTKHNRMF
jgi:hypothetical protein